MCADITCLIESFHVCVCMCTQEEYRCTQRAFNERFNALKSRKASDIDRIEERAARVRDIQKELSTPLQTQQTQQTQQQQQKESVADKGYDCSHLVQWQDVLNVSDQEVTVER